jgi:hypothetical protein
MRKAATKAAEKAVYDVFPVVKTHEINNIECLFDNAI